MILGLGIDLLENSRVELELARGEWLLGDGVFTAEEIRRCRSARKPALDYAACFAAKEATLKALGVPVNDLAIFREVEVGLGNNEEPRIILHRRLQVKSDERGVQRIHLCIAHTASQTSATVILED